MRGGKKQFVRESGYDDYSQPRNSKGAMRSEQRGNPVWEQGSMSSIEQQQQMESKRKASEYSISKPWDQRSSDTSNGYQRNVEEINYEVTAPWVEVAVDQNADLDRKLQAISSYQYESLWEPIELTNKKKQQLSNYRLNAPFQTKDSELQDASKPSRRALPGNNVKTLAPWEHGAQPSSPAPLKAQFDIPQTGFWDSPKPQYDPVESSGDPVLDNLRMQLKRHGASGILGLARKFKIMDDDNSGNLDMPEFCKAMRECEIADMSKKAVEHLFRYFDSDDSGTVSYNEFLVGIRGTLGPRRRALVQLAFDVLDKDRSGVVDLDDIRGVYNVNHHPEFLQGKKTEDELLGEFLINFEGPRGRHDGQITEKNFEEYYANVSASIDDDDYFELMVRNAWHISGGTGACANSSNRRVLITHADGTQTVEEVQNDIGGRRKDSIEKMRKPHNQGIPTTSASPYGSRDGSQGQGSAPYTRIQGQGLERQDAQYSPRGGAYACSAAGSAQYSPRGGASAGSAAGSAQHSTRGGAYACSAAGSAQHSPRGGAYACSAAGSSTSRNTAVSVPLQGAGLSPRGFGGQEVSPRMRPKSLSQHLDLY